MNEPNEIDQRESEKDHESQHKQSGSVEESGSTGPLHERINPVIAWGIIILSFIIFGLIGSIITQTQNLVLYCIFGYLGTVPFYAFLTKSGLKWRNNVNSHLQPDNQSQTSKTVSKRQICSTCGWKNSQENNFCHDCGTEL